MPQGPILVPAPARNRARHRQRWVVSGIVGLMAATPSLAGTTRPVNVLTAAPGGGVWAASTASVARFDDRGRVMARIELPAEAGITVDGLAASDHALWLSGWYRARLVTARGTLAPTGPSTGFVGVWDPRTLRLRWIMRLGTGGATARQLALATDGSAWVAGSTRGPLGIGRPQPAHGDSDAFVVHLSADGRLLGTLRYGTAGQDQARAVAIDADGNIAVGGQFGGPTAHQPSGAIDMRMALSVGPLRLAPRGDDDGFVIVLDAKGRVLGGTAIAAPGYDIVKAIRPLPGGWVAVGSMKRAGGAAGHISGSAPLVGFVSWLDASGRLVRTRFPAGVLSVHALSLGDHALWAAGHGGVGHAPREAVLLHIDRDQVRVVARCAGTHGASLGQAVAAGSRLWFGGRINGAPRCDGARPAARRWALFIAPEVAAGARPVSE